MKHKIIFALLLLFAFHTGLRAQTKELTLEDIFTKGYTFLPENLSQLNWIPNTNQFYYVSKGADAALMVADVSATDFKPVLTLKELQEIVSKMKGEAPAFPMINFIDGNSFWCMAGKTLLVIKIKEKAASPIAKLDDQCENFDVNSESMNLAYTKGNNLFVQKNQTEIQVTNESNPQIVSGKTTHRSEFGINKGTFWSPKGSLLAFYQSDETPVTDYPYVNFTTKPATLEAGDYPMAGMNNSVVKIGVFNVETKKTVWLETGEPKDQYLSNITWSADEKTIFVAQINRDQNHNRTFLYDASTGKQIKMLFEEKDFQYVQPMNGALYLPNNPQQFLWLSRRDGWNHLYHYDVNGKLIGQLTKGEWEIIDFVGFDKEGKFAFYVSNQDAPIERHLCKVEIATGKITKLTSKAGSHDLAKVSSDGKYFLDVYSAMNIPNEIALCDENGTAVKSLVTAKNPFADYKIGKIDMGKIKSKDGVDLYYRLITPPNFDKAKKYPVLVYVYGGPHSQLVQNHWESFGTTLWLQYMAAKGYVVFTLDNRGTDYRGEQFEQATFLQLGKVEIDDQLTGLDYLKGLGYCDMEKVGVFGWSYGGFMTTSLMLRAADHFKVGVAGAPVIDWKLYETVYTERYMDTPQTNEKGFEEANTLNHVGKLKGKLMLIQGTSDDVVVWQHTIQFVEAAIAKQKQIDYFIYPGHHHGVTGPARWHLFTKITNYFEDNLKK